MRQQAAMYALTLSALLIFSGCGGGTAHDHDHAGAQEHEHTQEHEHDHGVVDFPVACNEEAQEAIEHGLGMLHHMMYSQAMPHFEAAAEADPDCAMAHWGIAMASFQPLWHPTPPEGLERGKAAIAEAQAIGGETEREQAYIAAAAAFFKDPDPPAADRPGDHAARVHAWMEAQRELHEAFPDDEDAAAFYALAQVCYAMTQTSPDEPRDYAHERRAGQLLEQYLEDHPEHPGLFHYLIHAYDSTELAPLGEEVARGYDQIAPDVPHALHMPSHIFVRLGEWEDTADWNERSADAALRQPVNGVTSLHYPHALDYMMYAYLQLGDEAQARQTLEAVRDIEQVQPTFAAAYGIAAAQARYYLERGEWAEAAELQPGMPDALLWEDYPAAEALVYYARGLGAARTGDLEAAQAERDRIAAAVDALRAEGDDYWAHMIDALGSAVEAWVRYEQGETEQALTLMREAAEQQEAMDKSPITPGEVFPVRELYGELLLREGRDSEARQAFEASLERTPSRRNALAGIERAGG